MKALAIAIAIAGCGFSPDIGDGTITCGPKSSCPEGFLCGAGNRCYHTPPPPPPTDAAIDATPIDAAPDACKHHCMGPDCCN